jgi:hypothetical protein
MKNILLLFPLFFLLNCGGTDGKSDVSNRKIITEKFNQFVQDLWEDHNYNNSKFAVVTEEFEEGWIEYTGTIEGFTSNGSVYFTVFQNYVYGEHSYDTKSENFTFWFDTGDPKIIMDLKEGQTITINGKFSYAESSYGGSCGYCYHFYFEDAYIEETEKTIQNNISTQKITSNDIGSDDAPIYAHNLLPLIDSVWTKHFWTFNDISVRDIFDSYEGQWIEYTGEISQVGYGNEVSFNIYSEDNENFDFPDSFLLFFEFQKVGQSDELKKGDQITVMGKLNLIDWYYPDEGCEFCCNFMFTESFIVK